ncbi:MAG TPA: hypothetical protein PLE66_09255, partial [Thauera aminoaromatica]|nr:hypothetical protein [Thauera aminoaromatica]HMX13978.1 hypothetical protein [Thauera aminoaromatica]HMZ29833.1 hypothetical protein [Thauera aminoaromatica]HNB04558.1 hypothetical protein [Thauera aminoaromatica]HNC67538.1 hypothetical protein [Thauera aminoaromatica]
RGLEARRFSWERRKSRSALQSPAQGFRGASRWRGGAARLSFHQGARLRRHDDCEDFDTMEPVGGCSYVIRLCSGELRRWRFEGVDQRGFGWWLDEETGLGFSDASLMYAWEILERADDG